MKLEPKLWQESQQNELNFWRTQFLQGNLDQQHRNPYYLSKMEGLCSMIADYVTGNNLSEKMVMDLGSGPMGILHSLEAKRKVAVDSLMSEFAYIGYDTSAADIEAYPYRGEDLTEAFAENVFDLVFCLNTLEQLLDPQLVMNQVELVLKPGGDLIMLTDLRTIEYLDGVHKRVLTKTDVVHLIRRYDFVQDQVFPHGPGNPILQYIVHVKKRPV